jgi:hypothetical protein
MGGTGGGVRGKGVKKGGASAPAFVVGTNGRIKISTLKGIDNVKSIALNQIKRKYPNASFQLNNVRKTVTYFAGTKRSGGRIGNLSLKNFELTIK